MNTTERQNYIMKILSETLFATVESLAAQTFTSASSIRRDLTYLQNNGLVKRTHGGVTLNEQVTGVASFHKRQSANTDAKRLIAKKASVLLSDKQSVMLDGSSTVTFLLPYIAKFASIKLYVNNLSTALRAIELGIDTNCIGGHSSDGSLVLTGPAAYKAVQEINADVCFFSSQSIDINGSISDSTESENYLRSLMLRAAAMKVFLCDSSKFGKTSLYRLTDIDSIDYCIFDKPYIGLIGKCQIL